jgi:SAM-dependent methyltransferase
MRDEWFWSHYEWAASEVHEFLESAGVLLQGLSVADIGCGDGIIDLGISHLAECGEFVGYDLNPTNTNYLREFADAQGVTAPVPPFLRFEQSTATEIPADDNHFDLVVSWSAFEHISDILGVLKEIRRVLKPEGVFFCQVWPLYGSQHGSHLERWYPDGFIQLLEEPAAIRAGMDESLADKNEIERMWSEYLTLNRITLDDFGTALTDAGFDVLKLEILSHTVLLPTPLSRNHKLSSLGIAGFKLLAR